MRDAWRRDRVVTVDVADRTPRERMNSAVHAPSPPSDGIQNAIAWASEHGGGCGSRPD
jgi:hypothetical protein